MILKIAFPLFLLALGKFPTPFFQKTSMRINFSWIRTNVVIMVFPWRKWLIFLLIRVIDHNGNFVQTMLMTHLWKCMWKLVSQSLTTPDMQWRILFFACLGVSCAPGSALLGAKECTWGPTYWCKNLTWVIAPVKGCCSLTLAYLLCSRSAHGCHAVQHCIKSVWEHREVEHDPDDICTICKNMVVEARDQLESNMTMVNKFWEEDLFVFASFQSIFQRFLSYLIYSLYLFEFSS